MWQNGWGQMPKTLLYDTEVSSTAKLVFVEISSLCANKGYCFASNKYIADKFGMSETNASMKISELKNYLEIDNPKSGNRRIYLKENLKEPLRKLKGDLKENLKHNNISNNINNNGDDMNKNINGLIKKRVSLKWVTPYGGSKKERKIAHKLLQLDSYKNIIQLIDSYEQKKSDPFMPVISNLEDLYRKYPALKVKLEKAVLPKWL